MIVKNTITEIFEESLSVKKEALKKNIDQIEQAVVLIIKAINDGKKILFMGNGGSAADSQHIAAEFIGRFKRERRALPAIALTTDSSILTCLGNDYNFDIVFSRQIEGIGHEGDVVFGISTSGNSPNVVNGIKTAKRSGLHTIALTGSDGGELAKLVDICLLVPSKVTARIQESHLCIAHTICELVENAFTNDEE